MTDAPLPTISAPESETPLLHFRSSGNGGARFLRLKLEENGEIRTAIIPINQIAGLYEFGDTMMELRVTGGGAALLNMALNEAYERIYNSSGPKMLDLTPLHVGIAAKTGEAVKDGIYLGHADGLYWVVQPEKGLMASFNESSMKAMLKAQMESKPWQLPPQNVLRLMFNFKETGLFKGTYGNHYYQGTAVSVEQAAQMKFEGNGNYGSHSKSDTNNVCARFVYGQRHPPQALLNQPGL